MDFEFISNSVEETLGLGRHLASQLTGDEIIAFIGPLGSGKTHMTKGIAAEIMAENAEQIVNSPTFVLVNEYVGRLTLYHIDAYRLDSLSEFEALGFDDFCRKDAVVIIEWADKILPVLEGLDYMIVKIEYLSNEARKITIENLPKYISL